MVRTIILIAGFLLFPATLWAADATFEENFRDGVDALRAKNFGLALRKLERAQTQKDDPRLAYYLAFAHEKIGNCMQARDFYYKSLNDKRGSFELRKVSREALEGFEQRCSTSKVVRPIKPEPASNTSASAAGFVTLGWITTVLGTLTLVAIPVKLAVENGTLSDVEDYFSVRYGCTVERNEFGSGCTAVDEIKADPAYPKYETQINKSKGSTTAMIIAGSVVAGIGAITLVTVLIANSSKKKTARLIVSPHHVGVDVRF